jgi:glycosyltransferase involved in cell wall biosynthesis
MTGLSAIRVEDERETVGTWIDSDARIVISSRATSMSLRELFNVEATRFQIVPLSGDHARSGNRAEFPDSWSWPTRDYLVYAANISPHKNHELLLEAFADWGQKVPLVLTGEGADFAQNQRGQYLDHFSRNLGIKVGETLIPLGYISSEFYNRVLDRAWGLVMCSLAEGGGSFPVWEALLTGIPVICADIPVMREHMERVEGEVIWFNPHSQRDLKEKLNYLDVNYSSLKQRAMHQIKRLKHRSWIDVAEDYLEIIESIGNTETKG